MRTANSTRPSLSLLSAFVASFVALSASTASAQAQPRYLAQMQAELQAMGMAPQCAPTSATVGACTIRAQAPGADGRTPNPTARRFVVSMTYDDGSDTIYLYIERYATLRADAANAAQATRRLLELNWEMLASRVEWSPSTGEVRMSSLMHTDSNFDRRAFRSVLRSLLRSAERYAQELSQLTGSAVGESPAPTGNAGAAGANTPTNSAAPNNTASGDGGRAR
jgi:hypothetical protein